MITVLVSTVQVAFLRHELLKSGDGVDFFDGEQRDSYIDGLIDRVFCDLKA